MDPVIAQILNPVPFEIHKDAVHQYRVLLDRINAASEQREGFN